MDPLSLTASIITLLGTGNAIVCGLEQLASLRQAPNTILALNNEISDFRLVALEANTILREHQDQTHKGSTNSLFAINLGPILDHAREKLLELEKLLEYRLTSPGANGEARLNRLAWFYQQNKFKQIQEDFRSIKVNVVAAIGILTFRTASRTELQVADVRFLSHDLRSQNRQIDTLTAESLSSLGGVASTLPRMVAAQERTERRLDELLRSYVTSQGETSTSHPENASAQQNARPIGNRFMGQWSFQLLSVRKTDRSVCVADCACSCHQRSALRSPSYLHSLLGFLFVGYVGLPWLSPSCDNIKCQQMSDPVIGVRYFFPSWFIALALEFLIRISRPNCLTQNIRVLRVIWCGSKVFVLSINGDADGIKDLFIRREGSPFDVGNRYGDTPLANATYYGHVEACRVLLQAGADPYSEDFMGRQPHTIAWTMILGRDFKHSTAEAFRMLFPDPDLGHRRFSPIHSAVFGLSSTSLLEVLEQCSRDEVDEGDAVGRTALSWAAQRGDLEAVKFLLSHGANVNQADNNMKTPLIWAAFSGSQACAQFLLENRANVDSADNDGWTPLHFLVSRWDDVRLLNLLISHQANLNAINNARATSLGVAVFNKRYKTASKLLEVGVDVQQQDAEGLNVLCGAIWQNDHYMLSLLLRYGVDHTGEIRPFGSFLHLTAEFAGIESLRLLARGGLKPRDIRFRRRKDGLTALDVARTRSNVSAEWTDAFQSFLWSVDPTKSRVSPYKVHSSSVESQPHSQMDDLDSGEDVFVDAHE